MEFLTYERHMADFENFETKCATKRSMILSQLGIKFVNS